MKQQKRAGLLFIAFPLALQIPFTLLAVIYNYPEVLRDPPDQILQGFYEGGRTLVAAWYAYALTIFIFFAALLLYQPVSGRPRLASAIRIVGVLSASIHMIALLRWTFIVPLLARLYGQASSAATRELIELIFSVQHQFLGVGLGEHLGQLSLALWTCLMVRDLIGLHFLVKMLGYCSAILLALSLIEPMAAVFPFEPGIFTHGALIGFLLWSLWLITVGVSLVRKPAAASSR